MNNRCVEAAYLEKVHSGCTTSTSSLFLHMQAQCVATGYCRHRKDFFDEDHTHYGVWGTDINLNVTIATGKTPLIDQSV